MLDTEIQAQNIDLQRLQSAYLAAKEKEPEREKLASNIDRLKKMLPQYDISEELARDLKTLADKELSLSAALDDLKQKKASIIEQKNNLNQELNQLEDIEAKVSACQQEAKQIQTNQSGLLDSQDSLSRLNQLQRKPPAATAVYYCTRYLPKG